MSKTYPDFVFCCLCGRQFKQVTNSHLKKHDITMEKYKNMFPDAVLKSKDAVAFLGQKRPEHARKMTKKRIVKTCQGCGIEFEVLPSENYRKYCSASCYIHNANPMDNPKIVEKLSQTQKKHWQDPSFRKTHLPYSKRAGHANKGKLKPLKMRRSLSKTKTQQWKDLTFRDMMTKAIRANIKPHESPLKGKTYEEVYGEGKAKEIKNRISKSREGKYTGEDNSFYGRHHTKGTKELISKVLKEKWLKASDEYKNKHLKKIADSLNKRPTAPEAKMIGIIDNFNLPYKYVGNGYTFIGAKCPDFINFRSKEIIEVFGDYWHRKEEERERINHFAKYGYSTLVIWEHELNEFPEKEIVNIINTFTNS